MNNSGWLWLLGLAAVAVYLAQKQSAQINPTPSSRTGIPSIPVTNQPFLVLTGTPVLHPEINI